MFMVISIGQIGATKATMKTVVDVDLYVAQLRAKGHRKIMVAKGPAVPELYDTWRASRPEPRAKGI